MSFEFIPNYTHILKSALNETTSRLPLYEHIISPHIMEEITNQKFADLYQGNTSDLNEYFKHYCNFFKSMGYDTVSYENCIGAIMPGSGSLANHVPGVIRTREDFEKYPWDEIPQYYFDTYAKYFTALRNNLPQGMKCIGGVGNGVFECVQDITGYESLAFISIDDPELYQNLFFKVGEISQKIWNRFLKEFGDLYCVCRFGDDLGFKSATLISPTDIRNLIIPQYIPIVETVHAHNKPFLLHSCGKIFDVMPDMINTVKIDAKHSNEDQIAPFPVWVEKYGDQIGNFGGIDTDAVCRLNYQEMKEYISDVLRQCEGHGGFAFGSGNSIPDYVPIEGYLNMVEIIRKHRGDY